MIKNDIWIKSQEGMITPFEPSLIRKLELPKNQSVISYGLSSYGPHSLGILIEWKQRDRSSIVYINT